MKFRKKQTSRVLIFTLTLVLLTSQVSFAGETNTNQPVISNGEEYMVNGLKEQTSSYNATIGMTNEKAFILFEEYLKENDYTPNQIDLTKENLESFVEYAVEEGIIDDTQSQKAAITKAVVRGSLNVAAGEAEAFGWTTASACLRHSLQDNPTNVSISSSDPIATQVKNSSACKKIIADFKAYVRSHSLSARTTSGSTVLNSSTDLTLAFNKVSYVASGTKSSKGVWTLKITLKDTYDFDCDKWTNVKGFKASTINALNAYGAYAQTIGAVVPYKIEINVKTTFSE